MADVGVRPATILAGLITIRGLAAEKIAVIVKRQAWPDPEEAAASLDGAHAMQIKHFNAVSAALAVGLVFAALPMEADAQSRTRLAWPVAENSPDYSAVDRAIAALPQQAVTFDLRQVDHDVARATLPSVERWPQAGNTIAYKSQKVRVHGILDVTLTRSPASKGNPGNSYDYYWYCMWIEYESSDIPDEVNERALFMNVLWVGQEILHVATSQSVEKRTLEFYKDPTILTNRMDYYLSQPHCYLGSDPSGRAPQSVTFYFSQPFYLNPFSPL